MRRLLYTAVFFAGMTSLAVEFSASRLLGNYFGTSNLVWASIIGLILVYLTVGYFLGGRWADKSPHFRTFFLILTWGAFAVGLIPIIARPILRLASQAFDQLQIGVLLGSFISVMILFLIPVTLLGTASPFAIRLAIDETKTAGKISGRVYAISTIGSFIGTFLPTLVLIPGIGTFRTFLVFSGMLLFIGLYGLWRSTGWKLAVYHLPLLIVIILLAVLGVQGTDKTAQGLIYETESAYNYIQVREIQGVRYLFLNEGQGYHSVYAPGQLFTGGPWEQVLVSPFFNPAPYSLSNVKRIAILGLAAGTTARQAAAVYPNATIDGYEIDPRIVDVGRKYFAMNEPQLNVIVQDGRVGLTDSPYKYQIISVDAYRPPYIPPQMTTREFFQMVFNHLTSDGAMVINVGRSPIDRELIDSLYNTIRAVFPSAFVMDVPSTFNSIIYATVQTTSWVNLHENFSSLLQQADTPPLLLEALQIALQNQASEPALDPKLIFTDDLSPIERITNKMVLNFIFSDQMENLQ
jgi:predicted membrane-bound spermidine synthase